jgi:hypothetical protein
MSTIVGTAPHALRLRLPASVKSSAPRFELDEAITCSAHTVQRRQCALSAECSGECRHCVGRGGAVESAGTVWAVGAVTTRADPIIQLATCSSAPRSFAVVGTPSAARVAGTLTIFARGSPAAPVAQRGRAARPACAGKPHRRGPAVGGPWAACSAAARWAECVGAARAWRPLVKVSFSIRGISRASTLTVGGSIAARSCGTSPSSDMTSTVRNPSAVASDSTRAAISELRRRVSIHRPLG